MDPIHSKVVSLDQADAFEYMEGECGSENDRSSNAIQRFFSRPVTVATKEDSAIRSEQLPHRVRSVASKSKSAVLRKVSTLLTPSSFIKKKTSPAVSVEREVPPSTAGSSSGLSKAEDDDWQEIPDILVNDPLSINDADVIVSDELLVRSMGYTSFAAASAMSEKLLASEGLLFDDICQNEKRNTCYILATAAAFLATEWGKEAIIEMFSDKKDGSAVVTLFEPTLDKNVRVKVSLSRLFTNGSDLYSYAAQGNAWPAVLEKAVYGLNLAFQQLYTQEVSTAAEDGEYINILRTKLNHALNADNKAVLDNSDLFYAMERFPCVKVPVDENGVSQRPIYVQLAPKKGRGSDHQWDHDKQQLLVAVKLGFPVVLGTRKIDGERGVLQKIKVGWSAVTTGTPTGHAMAVLKSHTISEKGLPVEGILVFDPYGQKKGNISVDKAVSDNDFTLLDKTSQVQFIKWDNVPERFAHAVIAKGCPVVNMNNE